MTRVLLPRLGKGRKVLGGVVFTDGAAEASLGPSIRRLLELRGAAVIDSPEELDELTLEELHDLADRGGVHVPSHTRKADVIRLLHGESVDDEPDDERPAVDHEAEAKGAQIDDVDESPQEPAGDTSATGEAAPTEIAPETVAHDPEEGETWQPSPPSTTSATTTGSLSLQDRRRQHSQGS